MHKIYHNITFHIENSAFERWQGWILEKGIPFLFEYGKFKNAQLLQVQTFDTEAQTFCIQLEVADNQCFINFKENEEAKFRHLVFKEFGESVLPFITELKTIKTIENQLHTKDE